jgi:hypothetical protein
MGRNDIANRRLTLDGEAGGAAFALWRTFSGHDADSGRNACENMPGDLGAALDLASVSNCLRPGKLCEWNDPAYDHSILLSRLIGSEVLLEGEDYSTGIKDAGKRV